MAERFDDLERRMSSLFSDLGITNGSNSQNMPMRMESGRFTPTLDIGENEEEYNIHLDVPGIDRDDIEIEVMDNSLRIRGQRDESREMDGEDFVRRERRFGQFSRSLTLPPEIDRDKIFAEYRNGVLDVHLPKSAESSKRRKRIEVK
jgi:HSP20 family protein